MHMLQPLQDPTLRLDNNHDEHLQMLDTRLPTEPYLVNTTAEEKLSFIYCFSCLVMYATFIGLRLF